MQMNHALELKDHRALKNYLPRVPISNGCLLNALARVGQLPDGRKNIPEEARVGARVKEIKVAHLNCAVNKLVRPHTSRLQSRPGLSAPHRPRTALS